MNAHDPRPDLQDDSATWEALLSLAERYDCRPKGKLYGLLHGFRCMGTRLVPTRDRQRFLLTPDYNAEGWEDKEEWISHRDFWLKDEKEVIAYFLNHLGVFPETPIPENTHEEKEKTPVKVQAHQQELIETGSYRAKIKSISEVEGKFGKQLAWKFEVSQEPYAGQELTGWTNLSMSTTGKLCLWGAAAMNEVCDEELEFDTDDLIGKSVQLTIIEKTDTNGKTFNKVEDVRPAKRKTKAASKEETVPDDTEDPFEP